MINKLFHGWFTCANFIHSLWIKSHALTSRETTYNCTLILASYELLVFSTAVYTLRNANLTWG